MAKSIYKLTYFDLRGIAEPIRWIFQISKVQFEDHRLPLDNWYSENKEKFELGQLPILEFDNGQELVSSSTISRFLAKRFKLDGENEVESARCDELVDTLNDLRLQTKSFIIEQDSEKKAQFKSEALKSMPSFLNKFNRQVSKNPGKFAISSKVTWADLWLANWLELWEEQFGSEILADYEGLGKLKKTVFEIPEIKKWVEIRPKTWL